MNAPAAPNDIAPAATARDAAHSDAAAHVGPPLLTLSGAGNFRSLGGLVTRDGRRVRHPFLMRSDRLGHLHVEDWESLARTGLNTICDLRSREECAEHPNPVPGSFAVNQVACEVRNDLRGSPELRGMLVKQPNAAGARALMIEIYRRLPRQMAGAMARIVERLLAGGAPLLIHCTAGKDRTGFAVAVLLHALDVPREEIERDYLASQAWRHKPLHRALLAQSLAATLPADAVEGVVDPLLDVHTSYLSAAFEAASAEFGSLERYLEVTAGLDVGKRERLRELALA